MLRIRLFVAATALVTFAACDTINTDAERGVVGAGGGAVAATVVGANPVTGAVIGGAAGVFCDDLGVCQ